MSTLSGNTRSAASQPASRHPVLQPTEIGSLALANRVMVAPMSRVSAGPNGVPTGQMAAYYASFAAGGFGSIVTEGIYTDAAFSQSYEMQPGLVTAEQQQGWQLVTDAVHELGTPIVAQLMHGGALSQHLPATVAPSAIQPLGAKMRDYGGEGLFPLPGAMSQLDIDDVVDGFASAALKARAAGFDGVEIHAANGYLLDQFITPYTNQRDDEYGGSAEGRIKLTSGIITAIRSLVPADFVVGVRLSQTKVNDFDHRWSGKEEASVYFVAVAKAGASYIHIASEGRNWHTTAMLEPGVSITALARSVTGLPVVANGGMHDTVQASEVLNSGHADILALGSGALANPDWPMRVEQGLPIGHFDHRVLHPFASLDNAERVTALLNAEVGAA